MSDTPTTKIAIGMELEDVRKRFENIGGTREEFRQLVAEAPKRL
jgi:hypothetical protein